MPADPEYSFATKDGARGAPYPLNHPQPRSRALATVIVALLMFLAVPATAATVETLRAFVRETGALRARFTQLVYDRNMRKLQETGGTLALWRPGRIRWEIDKPYEQLIVGDGAKLWVYDKDLNQVTVRAMAQAIGGSPAALLAGGGDIEKEFAISAQGNDAGLDWLEAVPRTTETTFQRVRLGFGKSGLEAMELRDAFGQLTVIRFSQIERNPKLPVELFRFAPPKGVDVISD